MRSTSTFILLLTIILFQESIQQRGIIYNFENCKGYEDKIRVENIILERKIPIANQRTTMTAEIRVLEDMTITYEVIEILFKGITVFKYKIDVNEHYTKGQLVT